MAGKRRPVYGPTQRLAAPFVSRLPLFVNWLLKLYCCSSSQSDADVYAGFLKYYNIVFRKYNAFILFKTFIFIIVPLMVEINALLKKKTLCESVKSSGNTFGWWFTKELYWFSSLNSLTTFNSTQYRICIFNENVTHKLSFGIKSVMCLWIFFAQTFVKKIKWSRYLLVNFFSV